MKLYNHLYNNLPKGIKYLRSVDSIFPKYMGIRSLSFNMNVLNIPTFQFVSRTTHSLWIDGNKSNDKDINTFLLKKGESVLDNSMELSQEQSKFNTLSFDLDDSVGSNHHHIEDVLDYNEKILVQTCT